MRLTQIIEALLFASDAPLSATDLSKVDERLDEDTVEAVIQELRADYELSERSFQIYEVAGGFQLLTRPEFVSVLERYDSVPQPSRLSTPALEVLAIISYRQPLGRAEIEDIRGVGSSGVLRTLVERGLVEPVGRGEGLGRPLLYGTTRKFLEHFGFRSLEDLPRPDELPIVLRERTQPEPEPAGPDEAAASAGNEATDGATGSAAEAAAGSATEAATESAAELAVESASEEAPLADMSPSADDAAVIAVDETRELSADDAAVIAVDHTRELSADDVAEGLMLDGAGDYEVVADGDDSEAAVETHGDGALTEVDEAGRAG
jgi:segregation and condensation protein B